MIRAVGLLVALSASAQTIRFDAVMQPVIERRLAAARNTNIDRERTLHDLFGEAGCADVKLSEQKVKGSKVPNVICALEGKMESSILVGAHFDFVNKGAGIVDNWSGASLLPSLYQSLKGIPRRHNFVFAGFTDEELGLVGSHYYLHELSKDDVRMIAAMVNLDSLGAGPTKVETDRGDKRLVNAAGKVAALMKLPVGVVNVHEVGRSDSDSFQDKKVPTINFHSVTQETFPILHSPQDKMEAIHLSDYYDSYRFLSAYLAYLDETLEAEPVK